MAMWSLNSMIISKMNGRKIPMLTIISKWEKEHVWPYNDAAIKPTDRSEQVLRHCDA